MDGAPAAVYGGPPIFRWGLYPAGALATSAAVYGGQASRKSAMSSRPASSSRATQRRPPR